MRKILLITNADMSLQSGNVVLVLRRAEEIYRLYGVMTECIVVNKALRDIKILHQSPGMTFKSLGSREELGSYLKTGVYGMVIFYGERAYLHVRFVQKLLKADGIKTLVDFQGALEEQFEYSSGREFLLRYMKFFIKACLFRHAAANADGIIVVSDELKDYCGHYLSAKKRRDMRYFKMRCGVNDIIPDSQKLAWRREIRGKWGVLEGTQVLVFSGYRLAWQRLDAIIDYFKRCDKTGRPFYFAFFCNIDDAFAQQLKSAFPKGNYILEFLSFDVYMKHLCACDVGFIIRDYNMTNKVAFPNKFSDYMNAGLLPALNGALPEPMRIVQSRKMNYVDVDGELSSLFSACGERQGNLSDYYDKCNKLCREELIFETMVKNSDIMSMFKK